MTFNCLIKYIYLHHSTGAYKYIYIYIILKKIKFVVKCELIYLNYHGYAVKKFLVYKHK